MSLTGKSPADTYKDLLYVDNNNSGADSTVRSVKTGNGSATGLELSTRHLRFSPDADTTTTLTVRDVDDNVKLNVDTTNDQVKALGHHVNTQYAYFGIGAGTSANYSGNTHIGILYQNMNVASTADNFELGTGTDPATSFTTADGTNTAASVVVPCLWYVPDNISIDSVIGIEGGDNATGDTTRMHLMSYDFTSGSTSCLTNGTVLASNSDVTKADSEQAYLSTFTVSSATVTSGKVIVATFRSDSVNSDYSLNITVKYHLT